ncbi:ubiquitin-related modifier 1 [Cylindrobasidium torrendii FP15055 ss-10]|uniref:Ubiquitin-related modifier 1 n=1 Tax=Cylindrobasidium torrendii FP15055 ss-10 TaxID=1314674 RepID=A0A0D7BET9_9AGAR|nr:ubiquitin-related modifier 1 [Cylindrobasidium torrendii FP15055 ss-10]
MASENTLKVKIEFGGGLELLFDNKRIYDLELPATFEDDQPSNVDFLIRYMRDKLLKERVELFMEKDTIRPGILVLINDTDWELEGEKDYALKDGDEIVFISTLHGG